MVVSFARGLCGANLAIERVELADASGPRACGADVGRSGPACFCSLDARRICLPGRGGFNRTNSCRLPGSTHAGEAPAGPLPAGAAWEIMTGAPVPMGADAVVMIEHVERNGDRVRLLPKRTIAAQRQYCGEGRAGASRGRVGFGGCSCWVRADCACCRVRICAALGLHKRPRVAILTTGRRIGSDRAGAWPGTDSQFECADAGCARDCGGRRGAGASHCR